MMTISLPPAMAGDLTRDVISVSTAATSRAWLTLSSLITSRSRGFKPVGQQGVRPGPPESKADREARVVSIEINPANEVRLQSRQPMLFTAIALDRDGSPIHGLRAEWESSDKQVIFIKQTGQAIAGKPGRATLTAKAGNKREAVRVVVVEGTKEKFGGKKKQDSTRARRIGQYSDKQTAPATQTRTLIAKRNHGERITIAPPPIPMRDPNDDPLPDNETNALYQPGNIIGSPPGKRKPGAPGPAIAPHDNVETNGTQNFSFALQAAGLAGRGLEVSLPLVFNSAVWTKSTDSSNNTWMTYDVDSSWPATGWRITLGQIEDQGSYGFTLTDMDGTRHALVYTSSYNYDTTDGTFIHYYGGGSWGVLYYPDGTTAYYGAGGGGYRLYPTEIIDRNGNYILISYAEPTARVQRFHRSPIRWVVTFISITRVMAI